ncbi:hypothetical protein BB560_004806, partial [Smittium megazygosporum]
TLKNWRLEPDFKPPTLKQPKNKSIILDGVPEKYCETRSALLLQISELLWSLLILTGMRPTMDYIPKYLNPIGFPFRLSAQIYWSLAANIFKEVDRKLGPHNPETFASSTNRKLPTYMSWYQDPLATQINAFNRRKNSRDAGDTLLENEHLVFPAY